MTGTFQIDFEPVGRRGEHPAGESLLEAARRLGVDLVAVCGGKGTCERCIVQLLSGLVSPHTTVEETTLSEQALADGYRLACQVYPLSDCKLHIPPESLTTPQRTQVEGLEVTVEPASPVQPYAVQLSPPSLADPQADAARLRAALSAQRQATCASIDIDVLRSLSPELRAWNWAGRAWLRDSELVALGSPSARGLGLAVDVGTTKIAGYLVDMETGRTMATRGKMNPQVAYGEDVIARITYARDAPTGTAQLQKLAVATLNELAGELCAEVKAGPQEIVEAVVVANTAIHHLLLDLPVEQLAFAPYVPAVNTALDVKARDVGLRLAPGAYVHFLPNIAGFVGADHVAMLLAADVRRADGVVLALDIGTNTEICLADRGKLTSLSCPSGPAFEGAHIKDGMRAARGAIEHVRLVDNRLEFQTIDHAPAVGLCGSGVLDVMAQLYLAGVLDRQGRLSDHPRVRVMDGAREFVLVSEAERDGQPAISFTQNDVQELQLAKGAIGCGIRTLVQAKDLEEEEIDQVIIAGAFGTYIDVASAVTVGMLPSLPLDRFRQVGNAAGMGARLALISQSKRAEAQALAQQVNYVELATSPDFTRFFAEAMYIGNILL